MPCHSSAERRKKKKKTYKQPSAADGNSRNATWQLKRGGLASFWRYSAGCNASWSGLRRWWPYSASPLYNKDAFQRTPPNRRPVPERLESRFIFSPGLCCNKKRSRSLCIMNIWVTVTVNESRWFSAEVFDERIPRQRRKVRWKTTSLFHGEGGERGFGLLLDTTGNRKCETDADFLPKAANQSMEA